ncbi:ATP-binding protein [Streptomyces sp. NPDC047000]|uniref:ATP-binding protein n=1 Tax=Streptomyces sp. NPDC047000 TaxID=3155474 RepID=UPI0033EAA2CF
MIELPDLVTGGLAVGALSALVLGGSVLRSRRRYTALRAEADRLHARLDAFQQVLTAEVEHLAAQRVPATARQLAHPHVAVPGPVQPHIAGTPLGIALEAVLTGVRAELAAQRTRVDAAAQAGMRGAVREIQAALYRLQDALRTLQQRYDEPELAQTLFELDHENEQSLRRAQVAAVVCGAWVGLAREESHLVDAVTGGQARLADYRRVKVHNHLEPGTALVPHAVEPVAVIAAELLDNALRHSSPDTDVVVNLEHVHHGVCVTVDDAGLGMTQDERVRARRLVAGREPILLTDLGDPPRMGLAAVGRLTRQFDLSVDLSSPSPYGGVRAVLRVDSHLLSRLDPAELPPAASAPRSTRTHRPAQPPAAAAPEPEPPQPAAHGHGHGHGHGHAYGSEPDGTAGAAASGHHGPRGTEDTRDVAGARDTGDARGTRDAAGARGTRDLRDTGGLPRRRRRSARPAAGPQDAPYPEHRPQPAVSRQSGPEPSARRPEEAAAALGALQAGTAAARTAPLSDLDDTVPGAARPRPAGAADATDHEGGAVR